MSLHLITGYAGKKHVTASDQGSYNMAMLGNGQFVMDRGSKFAASIITNNTVRVMDGDIMMQGRHIRQKENTYDDLQFENGTQGIKRHDLIVVRYTKDASTGIEGCSFAVIKGTPSEMNPVDPEYIVGDITEQSGNLVNDMPLFRVVFEGLTLTSVVPIFETVDSWKTIVEGIQDTVAEACKEVVGNIGTTEEFASMPYPTESLAKNITKVNANLQEAFENIGTAEEFAQMPYPAESIAKNIAEMALHGARFELNGTVLNITIDESMVTA